MINKENLDKSITEAERFIERANAAKTRIGIDEHWRNGCSETARVKRASFDLSESLIELRRATTTLV